MKSMNLRVFCIILLVTFFIQLLPISSFAAASPPSIDTYEATSIGESSATLNGVVAKNGAATITEYGFKYCVTGTGDYKTVVVGSAINTGVQFSKTITGLTPGEKYSFFAYAKNSVGDSTPAYSKYFTTQNIQIVTISVM